MPAKEGTILLDDAVVPPRAAYAESSQHIIERSLAFISVTMPNPLKRHTQTSWLRLPRTPSTSRAVKNGNVALHLTICHRRLLPTPSTIIVVEVPCRCSPRKPNRRRVIHAKDDHHQVMKTESLPRSGGHDRTWRSCCAFCWRRHSGRKPESRIPDRSTVSKQREIAGKDLLLPETPKI